MTATADVARAAMLVDAEQWNEALRLLGPHVASAPDDTYAWCLIARAQLGLGQVPKALEASASAIASAPGNEWPYRLRAIALTRQRRFREARDAVDEAIRLAPNTWTGHHLRAQIDLQAGFVSDATWEAARRAVELAPDEPPAHEILGLVAMHEKDRRLASSEFYEVLRLDPTNTNALNNLAVMQLRRRRLGRATSQLVHALRLEPNDPLLIRNLRAALRVWAAFLDLLGMLGCIILLTSTHGHTVQTGVTTVPGLTLPNLPGGVFTAGPGVVITLGPYDSGASTAPFQVPTYKHVDVVGHPAALWAVSGVLLGLVLFAAVSIRRSLGSGAARIVRAALRDDAALGASTSGTLVAVAAVIATLITGLPTGRFFIYLALVLHFVAALLSRRFRQRERPMRGRIQVR